MENLISIVVPIYNVQDYLERCIQSIVQQTYTEIEIILIDDGSTDRSAEICDKYIEKDNRIIVIHKKNGGLSDARNTGLKIAKGNYIVFVDSDDWIAKDYLKTMYDISKEYNADIVECNVLRTDGNIEYANTIKNEKVIQSYNTIEGLKLLIEDQIFHQTVWNKMYSKKVIDQILFEVGKYNEDEFWTYQVFGNANKIVKTEDILYYYYQRSGSIMGQGYKLKRLDAIEAKVERQQYIDKKFPMLSSVAATNLMGSIIYAGQMSILYLTTEERKIAYKYLKKIVSERLSIFRYKYEGILKHKVWYWLAHISLNYTCKLRNLLKMNV